MVCNSENWWWLALVAALLLSLGALIGGCVMWLERERAWVGERRVVRHGSDHSALFEGRGRVRGRRRSVRSAIPLFLMMIPIGLIALLLIIWLMTALAGDKHAQPNEWIKPADPYEEGGPWDSVPAQLPGETLIPEPWVEQPSKPMFAPGASETEPSQLVFLLGEGDGEPYLYAEGSIGQGSYNAFLEAVNTLGKDQRISRLVMHSKGGLLEEAILISQFLRLNNWDFMVDGSPNGEEVSCASACGLIAVAADKITFDDGLGRIGFHRPYIPGVPDTPENIQEITESIMPFWKAMGASPQLFQEMIETGREEMFWLTAENAGAFLTNAG